MNNIQLHEQYRESHILNIEIKARYKGIYTASLYLTEQQKRAKVIYGVRSQDGDSRWGITGRKGLRTAGYVLFLPWVCSLLKIQLVNLRMCM